MADYTYDESTREYHDDKGRIVSRQTIRAWILAAMASGSIELQAISDRLIAEKITAEEWHALMLDQVADMHTAVAMIAAGGEQSMTDADYQRLAVIINGQDSYLSKFAEQVKASEVERDKIAPRAASYTASVWSTFENILRSMEIDADDATEEQRVLDPGAEHCQPRDGMLSCEDYAEMGWQPVGSGVLPAISEDTPCSAWCRCFFQFR